MKRHWQTVCIVACLAGVVISSGCMGQLRNTVWRKKHYPLVTPQAPSECDVTYEPAFYGYHGTCWRQWPEGWVPCAEGQVLEVIEQKPLGTTTPPVDVEPSPSDLPPTRLQPANPPSELPPEPSADAPVPQAPSADPSTTTDAVENFSPSFPFRPASIPVERKLSDDQLQLPTKPVSIKRTLNDSQPPADPGQHLAKLYDMPVYGRETPVRPRLLSNHHKTEPSQTESPPTELPTTKLTDEKPVRDTETAADVDDSTQPMDKMSRTDSSSVQPIPTWTALTPAPPLKIVTPEETEAVTTTRAKDQLNQWLLFEPLPELSPRLTGVTKKRAVHINLRSDAPQAKATTKAKSTTKANISSKTESVARRATVSDSPRK